MSEEHAPVITLDGPSGTGKGTISLMLARHFGWHFLDSGALYRVLAYAAKRKSIDFDDIEAMVTLAHALDLRFEVNEKNISHVFLDKENISDAIRSERCGQDASQIAAIPEIRKALLSRQRAFAKLPGLVTDGRDMGTVVFPNAILKIYLDASLEERASRRYLQLKEKGNDVSLAQVVEELARRDERDTARTHSPLKPAPDAVQIDTTKLTIVQVFNNVLQLAKKSLFVQTDHNNN
ncbi:(d)CMP kinase [Legionella nagasakiensis]|uniref:(d)CMP kinase n=1 Tax=Legionella nagasakiensis TaxID=535290 RepID=UPI001055185B|nr:(d)CMP kinase [Legionella nagasakiensis]